MDNLQNKTSENGIWLAHVGIIGVNLIHSFNYIIAKDVMPNYVKPFGFIILRVWGAMILFWLSSLFIKQNKIEKADWPRLIICSIFGVGLNQILFLKGLSLASPIDASIMMSCTPILVLALTAILLKEKLQTNQILGVGFGFLGAIILIVNRGDIRLNSGALLGNGLIFLNALSWGLYLVLAKPLMLKYHPITITTWAFLLGCFLALPFGWNEILSIDWNTLPPSIIYGIIYVVVMTTFVAYFLNMHSLKKLSPTVVSFYIYIQPICTALIAISLGKDEITIVKVFAGILIFAGIYFVNVKKNSPSKSFN
jgi:drug/metabolite transporter (DMT)-like permease